MNGIGLLVLAGLVSWALRVAFIAAVPARHLPGPVADALEHLPPAVLAAVVAVELAGAVRGPAGPALALLVATTVTALVAWRTRSLMATTGTGLVMVVLLELSAKVLR